MTAATAPPPATPSGGEAAISDTVLMVLMVSMACCVVISAFLCRMSTRSRHGGALRIFTHNDDQEFVTHVYIEAADISCDFQMRLTSDELRGRSQLLEAISRAACEATEIPLSFTSASVERLDERGQATFIKTDTDCRRLRDAVGIRVTQDTRKAASEGMVLLQAHDDDGEDDGDVGRTARGDRESLLLGQF